MGYIIFYEKDKINQNRKKRGSYAFGLVCLSFLLLFAAVCNIWTEMRKSILYSILPGDPVVTAAAISELTDDLRSGSTISFALKDFVTEVLEGAGFDSGR